MANPACSRRHTSVSDRSICSTRPWSLPARAITPTVYPIRWGRHQERDHEHDDWCDEDGRGVAELRSYRVQDRAGNQVSLVEMVKKEGKEIKVYVIGLRYEDANGPGRFIFLWNARKTFEWSV